MKADCDVEWECGLEGLKKGGEKGELIESIRMNGGEFVGIQIT